MQSVVEQLTALTLGLLFISESDFEWKVESQITKLDEIELVDSNLFFKKLIEQQDPYDEFLQSQALRYKSLEQFIRKNYKSCRIYKSGAIRRTLVVELEDEGGKKIYLTTTSIET